MTYRYLILCLTLGGFGCSDDSSSPTGSAGGAGTGGSNSGGSGATSGTGGSTTGGTAGTSSGGTAGTSSGGTAGTSSGGTAGTGGAPGAECKTADDCALFSDCCACTATAPGEADPAHACPLDSCFADQCTAQGDLKKQCVSGRCVLTVNCDLSTVSCAQPAPMCPAGFTLTTDASGLCYGNCIQISECPKPPVK